MPFRLPIINFSATHYTELLEWEKEPITEPPLTTDLRRRRDTRHRYLVSHFRSPSFPCRRWQCGAGSKSGVKERAVKVVTEAASAALGEEQRVWISGRLRHRRQLPNMQSLTKNT